MIFQIWSVDEMKAHLNGNALKTAFLEPLNLLLSSLLSLFLALAVFAENSL